MSQGNIIVVPGSLMICICQMISRDPRTCPIHGKALRAAAAAREAREDAINAAKHGASRDK